MYDDIMKAETFAETYVAISKMSDEEVNSLLNTLTGPTAQNVPKMVDLPLTPKEVENLKRLKEAGKNMPLTVQGKRQIAQAVEAAKKRKVNQKRTAFQQALNQPKKVENPVRRAKRLSQTQQPAQPQYNDPKTSDAMTMLREVQANKRRRLGQEPVQQNVPLPKTQRTMSNEEMQRRMKARREKSQQTPLPPPPKYPPAPPREIPFPPPSQQTQQPQQTQQTQQPRQPQQLPPRVKSILRKPRRRIQRKQPVTVNPDA